MNVAWERRAFKQLVMHKELQQIEELSRIANEKQEDGAFLRDPAFHAVIGRLMELIRIEETDPENVEKGKRRGITVEKLRAEGRALFEGESAEDLFAKMSCFIVLATDSCEIRAVVVGMLPHLREAMIREGLMPEEDV